MYSLTESMDSNFRLVHNIGRVLCKEYNYVGAVVLDSVMLKCFARRMPPSLTVSWRLVYVLSLGILLYPFVLLGSSPEKPALEYCIQFFIKTRWSIRISFLDKKIMMQVLYSTSRTFLTVLPCFTLTSNIKAGLIGTSNSTFIIIYENSCPLTGECICVRTWFWSIVNINNAAWACRTTTTCHKCPQHLNVSTEISYHNTHGVKQMKLSILYHWTKMVLLYTISVGLSIQNNLCCKSREQSPAQTVWNC